MTENLCLDSSGKILARLPQQALQSSMTEHFVPYKICKDQKLNMMHEKVPRKQRELNGHRSNQIFWAKFHGVQRTVIKVLRRMNWG